RCKGRKTQSQRRPHPKPTGTFSWNNWPTNWSRNPCCPRFIEARAACMCGDGQLPTFHRYRFQCPSRFPSRCPGRESRPCPDPGQNRAPSPAPGAISPVPIFILREELRLDIDGRYPQMVASGTSLSGLVMKIHWIANLQVQGPNHWSGSIWYKDGAVATFPYT